MIQQDPELWEIVDNAKHPDQEPMEFFEGVGAMLAIEFEELHRTDLKTNLLDYLVGYQRRHTLWLLTLLHIALEMFLLKASMDEKSIKEY